jgi:SAM-dependent methyltransferase
MKPDGEVLSEVSDKSTANQWYKEFFSGAALDLWRNAKSPEETEDECAFLQEVLNVSSGAHLLDVPCGNGRLSIPMAKASLKVTGLDYCEEFVLEAGKAAKSAKLNAELLQFVQGDMRVMSFAQKFDGAFCMGNSFGYFDREGTNQSFTAIGNSLKSGAKLVLDSVMIAESFLVNGGEREWVKVGDMLMLIENAYNCREGFVKTDYTFIRNGNEEQRQAVHWIYTAGEVCAMLETAGFSVLNLFSSTECDPYLLGSERLLLVAEKY